MSATLKSRLPQIAAELRPKVSAAVKQGAKLVSDDARARVPIGPPEVHLRDHFHVTRLGGAEYEVSVGGREGDDPFYAHMVENGTTHSPPQPFLVPALEAHREDVEDLVRVALGSL